MSIESTLERIAVALEAIVTLQSGATNAKSTKSKPSSAPEQLGTAAAIPAPPVAAPIAQPALPVAPVAPVQQPGPAPSFMDAAPVACPITDQKSLLAYVMAAYTSLGPEKGGRIQEILTTCGVAHLNDVKPEHYANIYAGVEALKAI